MYLLSELLSLELFFEMHPCCSNVSSPLLLLLSNIPSCRLTIVCLGIYLLVNIWFVSSFSQLNIKLLQRFMYKHLYHHMILFLLVHMWE